MIDDPSDDVDVTFYKVDDVSIRSELRLSKVLWRCMPYV